MDVHKSHTEGKRVSGPERVLGYFDALPRRCRRIRGCVGVVVQSPSIFARSLRTLSRRRPVADSAISFNRAAEPHRILLVGSASEVGARGPLYPPRPLS